MSYFPRSLMLCLALLVSAGGLGRLAAKPPDLPVDEKVDCKDTPELQRAGGVLPGIPETGTVNTAAGEESSPAAGADEEEGITLRTFCPWHWPAVRACWQSMTHCCGCSKLSGGAGDAAATKESEEAVPSSGAEEQEDPAGYANGAELLPAPTPKPSPFTCPYLKEQAEKTSRAAPRSAATGPTALENLRRLTQAHALYRRAEKCREEGNVERACECYKEVQTLCPGSLYGQMATARLREMQPAEETGTEQEDEVTPNGKGNEPDAWSSDLIPDPPPQDFESDLKPPLPPIDPKVVDALEQVLGRVGDPATAKVIVQDPEPNPPAGAEEQEEPVSQWPYTPPDPVVPPTLVDPPPDEISGDDGSADEDQDEPEADRTPPCEDVNELLRAALDALQDGTCTEVDCSRLGECRVQAELQVGAVTLRVVTDRDSGLRFMVLSLVPEASRDMRAAQRAHNDRISRWIESMNDNTAGSAAAEDPAWDEEDDGPDDELQAHVPVRSETPRVSSLRQSPEPHGSVRTARKGADSVAR